MKPFLIKIILLLGMLLPLTGCADKASEPGPNLGKISPGLGVAEAQLFDSRTDVEKKLGSPDTDDPNPFNANMTIVQYYDQGLEITFDKDSVASVVLYPQGGEWKKTYAGSTKEGLWPESNVAAFKKAWGAPLKELPQALVYTGMTVSLNEQGQVEYLSIVRPEEK